MITRRRLMKAAAVSAFAVDAAARRAHAQGMHAQTWPSRHVRLVVPFPPGGGTDAVARIVASRLSGIWGHQMVIENKGGAGSNLGAEAVARSDPDGYTVLVGSLPLAVNRYLYSSLGYDPIADFAPVTLIAVYPNLMVVPNSSPARSVAEFVAHAKANPGRITFASSGVGTSTHLSGELFKRMTGIEMTHVPYRGVALALNDVIPGRIDVMFNTMAGVLQQVRSGQLRGLAVTSTKRFPTAPELPTVADTVPGFDVLSWYALFVPARTPAAIVRKLHGDTVAILREPDTREKLEKTGVLVVGSTPEELAAQLRAETELWGPVIKAAGIKPQG